MFFNKDRMNKREAIIKELNSVPTDVLALALVYAKYSKLYGENITKAWDTAVQQKSAMDNAYARGYYEALTGIEYEPRKDWDLGVDHERV